MSLRSPPSLRRRLARTRTIVVCALLATFCLAPRPWLTQPLLSPLPIWSRIRFPGWPWDVVILLGMAALLLPVLISRRPRRWMLLWCTVFAIRCIWDQVAWQPYLLVYFSMLLTLSSADWEGSGSSSRNEAVVNANRFILTAVYFWTGLSKANYWFMVLDPPSFLRSNIKWIPLVHLARAIPFIQMALAAGLLMPRTRRVAMVTIILMHVLDLLTLGPFTGGRDLANWLWNLAMILLLYTLFSQDRHTQPGRILAPHRLPWQPVVVLLFGVCPLLSYVGFWSPDLSFRRGSRNVLRAQIVMTSAVFEQMPGLLRLGVEDNAEDPYVKKVDIKEWSERYLHTAIPITSTTARQIAQRLCALTQQPEDLRLILEAPFKGRTSPTTRSSCDCSELTGQTQ